VTERSLVGFENKWEEYLWGWMMIATYHVKGLVSIYFQMPSGDVVELDFVLYFPDLTKNVLLVSCMMDL
jgi:hypothetical protein